MLILSAIIATMTLSSCHQITTTQQTKQESNAAVLLYFEEGSDKAYHPSTALFESGGISPYDAYVRGYSYAIPKKILEEPLQCGLSSDKWRLLDYANYDNSEIFLLEPYDIAHQQYAVIANQKLYYLSKSSEQSTYLSWSMYDNCLFIYENQPDQSSDALAIHALDMTSGRQSDFIVAEKDMSMLKTKQLFCDEDCLYYLTALPDSNQFLFTQYNLKTQIFLHHYSKGWPVNFFLTPKELLLISRSSENELVIEHLSYDFALNSTDRTVSFQDYVIGLFVGEEKIVMQNDSLYAIMATAQGQRAYFSYDLNKKVWTEFYLIDIPKKSRLMDYHFMYRSPNQELLLFKPHVVNHAVVA